MEQTTLLVLHFDAFLLMAVEMSRSLGLLVSHDLACLVVWVSLRPFRSFVDKDKLSYLSIR